MTIIIIILLGPSRSWSYGVWIYNYLCNHCLSPYQIVQLLLHFYIVFWDIMKQPGAILVLPVLYTILVFHNTGITSILPESSSICNIRRYWSLPKYEYCRYRKILGNTGYTSIADTATFWKILIIPVLQILEDSGKYRLYQYCRYWKIRYEVTECTCILFSLSCLRLLWEDGQCIGRQRERRLGAEERRRGGRTKWRTRYLLFILICNSLKIWNQLTRK